MLEPEDDEVLLLLELVSESGSLGSSVEVAEADRSLRVWRLVAYPGGSSNSSGGSGPTYGMLLGEYAEDWLLEPLSDHILDMSDMFA